MTQIDRQTVREEKGERGATEDRQRETEAETVRQRAG